MNINNIEQKVIPIIRQTSQTCLMSYFTQAQVSSKVDGSLVTQADIAVQSEIQKQLKIHYPEYDFFAEELSDTEKDNFFTADHPGFWILWTAPPALPMDCFFCYLSGSEHQWGNPVGYCL